MIQIDAIRDTSLLASLSVLLSLSIYTLKNNGDKIPPCLTPLDVAKKVLKHFPHLTTNSWEQHHARTRITGTYDLFIYCKAHFPHDKPVLSSHHFACFPKTSFPLSLTSLANVITFLLAFVCLFVCLPVCLFVSNITQKFIKGYCNENLWRGPGC